MDYTDAACRDEDPELFFPERTQGNSVTVHRAFALQTAVALTVCGRCPLWDSCLEDNIGLQYGIVGGTTEEERAKLRRRRGIPVMSSSNIPYLPRVTPPAEEADVDFPRSA